MMPEEGLKKYNFESDLSSIGAGDMDTEVSAIKRDLEGWREMIIPLSSLLRWDQPFYPGIIVGVTSIIFLSIWYIQISTLTTFSIVFILLGVVDFVVPFLGPSITGYKSWTVTEESQFTQICESIATVRHDVLEVWQGLFVMRQNNSKKFFVVVMGTLAMGAWIGNVIDNLFLTYIIVNFVLLWPGLMHNPMTHSYLVRFGRIIRKLTIPMVKAKSQ